MKCKNKLSQLLACMGTMIILSGSSMALATQPVTHMLETDAVSQRYYGISSAICGNVAIVGASLNSDAAYFAGAAYVFRWNGSNWAMEQELYASDFTAYDYFGGAVAIDGNLAVVVASGRYTNGVQTGMAYIFRYNGSTWVEEQKIPIGFSATPDLIKPSVAISQNVIALGNMGDRTKGPYAGSANVLFHNGSTWMLAPKLLAADGSNVDFFGAGVGVAGDWVIVGAPADDDMGSSTGSAYVFRRNQNGTPAHTSDDFWQQTQKLIPPDGAAYIDFGSAVAINGNAMAIGAAGDDNVGVNFGSVYVYRLVNTTWHYEDELHGSGSMTNGGFGSAVDISGDRVVVGAFQERPFWLNGGSAYVFRKYGSIWAEEMRLEDPNAYANNYFGNSVGISGEKVVVGAYKATFVGAAQVFDLAVAATPTPTPTPVPDSSRPSITLTSPKRGMTMVIPKALVAFTASASDNIGVTQVDFYVNDDLLCVDATAPYICTWRVPDGVGQTYKINASAFDAAGNEGRSATITVRSKKN